MRKKKEVNKPKWFNFNKAIILLLILALFVIIKTIFIHEVDLEEEAKSALFTLTDGFAEISLVDSNGLAEEKIENLDQMDYDEMKNILGLKNDFCIFFEDATGNLVRIDDASIGIGSDKIYINGEPCK